MFSKISGREKNSGVNSLKSHFSEVTLKKHFSKLKNNLSGVSKLLI